MHIPDCNVQATVGQHFLFHEPIPKAVNGPGYLRVIKKSLWWQHEQFPSVWTSEGLTTCLENGYQGPVNSTMWNHLQTMWQAPPLDLLRLVYEETHHQNILEASGYRSPTGSYAAFAIESFYQGRFLRWTILVNRPDALASLQACARMLSPSVILLILPHR
jgi:hypothetical protein